MRKGIGFGEAGTDHTGLSAGQCAGLGSLDKTLSGQSLWRGPFHAGQRTRGEDATHEIFIKVYRLLETFNGTEQAFLPWLLAIARNCCIDRLRRAGTRRKYEDGAAAEAAAFGTDNGGPETDLSREQRTQFMYRAPWGWWMLNSPCWLTFRRNGILATVSCDRLYMGHRLKLQNHRARQRSH